jgi:hypothetical protein
MADYSYLQHVMEENDRLRAQVALLLPWARLGARVGVTDSNWNDAAILLERIESGEFGEVK